MKGEAVDKVIKALTPTVTIEKAMNLPGGGTALVVCQEYEGLPGYFPLVKLVHVRANDEGEILEAKGI